MAQQAGIVGPGSQSWATAAAIGCYPLAEASQEEVTSNRAVFEATLNNLCVHFNKPLKLPTVGGVQIDPYLLYCEVSRLGGYKDVVEAKQWVQVCSIFNFSQSFTNRSFVVRTIYVSLLFHYEQVYLWRDTGPVADLSCFERHRPRKSGPASPLGTRGRASSAAGEGAHEGDGEGGKTSDSPRGGRSRGAGSKRKSVTPRTAHQLISHLNLHAEAAGSAPSSAAPSPRPMGLAASGDLGAGLPFGNAGSRHSSVTLGAAGYADPLADLSLETLPEHQQGNMEGGRPGSAHITHLHQQQQAVPFTFGMQQGGGAGRQKHLDHIGMQQQQQHPSVVPPVPPQQPGMGVGAVTSPASLTCSSSGQDSSHAPPPPGAGAPALGNGMTAYKGGHPGAAKPFANMHDAATGAAAAAGANSSGSWAQMCDAFNGVAGSGNGAVGATGLRPAMGGGAGVGMGSSNGALPHGLLQGATFTGVVTGQHSKGSYSVTIVVDGHAFPGLVLSSQGYAPPQGPDTFPPSHVHHQGFASHNLTHQHGHLAGSPLGNAARQMSGMGGGLMNAVGDALPGSGDDLEDLGDLSDFIRDMDLFQMNSAGHDQSLDTSTLAPAQHQSAPLYQAPSGNQSEVQRSQEHQSGHAAALMAGVGSQENGQYRAMGMVQPGGLASHASVPVGNTQHASSHDVPQMRFIPSGHEHASLHQVAGMLQEDGSRHHLNHPHHHHNTSPAQHLHPAHQLQHQAPVAQGRIYHHQMLGSSASLPAPLSHTITSGAGAGAGGSLPTSGGPTPRGMAAFEVGVRAAGHARRYHVEGSHGAGGTASVPSQVHSAGPSLRTPLLPAPSPTRIPHLPGPHTEGGNTPARELTRLGRGQQTSSSQALAALGVDGDHVAEQGQHPGVPGSSHPGDARLSSDEHPVDALQAGITAAVRGCAGVVDNECDSGYDNGPEALKKMRMRTDGGSAPTARLRSIAQEAVALGSEEEQGQGQAAGSRGEPDGYGASTKDAGMTGYNDAVQQQLHHQRRQSQPHQQHTPPSQQQWVPSGEVDGITVVAVAPSRTGSIAGVAAQAAAAAAVASGPGTVPPSVLGTHTSLPLKASHSLKVAAAGAAVGPTAATLATSCSVPAAPSLSGMPHTGASGLHTHLGFQMKEEEEEELERMWTGVLGTSALPL